MKQMSIGERLRERRNALKLTQEEVSERLGVTRQTMSNWENGRSFPDIERVVQLSEIYGLSLDVLLKGDPELMSYLQESTNSSKWFKVFTVLLVINSLLMITLISFPSISVVLLYLVLGLIGVNALSLFYLVVKKI